MPPMSSSAFQENEQDIDVDVDVDDLDDLDDLDGDSAAVTPPSSPADIEQEREAILRMIAEGRVTPEEGDLLLEALGS